MIFTMDVTSGHEIESDYWVLYWLEIILHELGHGGSRDRLRSLCVPSSRQISTNPSFFVWPFCCLQRSTIQLRFRSGDPLWPSSLRIRSHVNREPSLAFDLVTHRGYFTEWPIATMNVVLTLFDPVVDIGYPAFITFQVINFDVLSIPPVSSSYPRPRAAF